jgi:PTH1 family peptidyl-tRNA hydrolase
MVVDTIVNRYGGTPWKKKFQGLASEVILKQEKLIFLKPSTFMNLSGQSVSDACRFFKLSSTEICVFHDELDLPFLKIRTKIGGGHAGHNGLRSIQQHLGSDYFRVRLGIGHPGDRAKVASYVLNNFPKSSEADLSSWLEAVAEGFPQLKEANQEKFLNIVNGQSNTAKKTSDGKVPRTKLAPSNEPLNISKETKKSALERLLEKFR